MGEKYSLIILWGILSHVSILNIEIVFCTMYKRCTISFKEKSFCHDKAPAVKMLAEIQTGPKGTKSFQQ